MVSSGRVVVFLRAAVVGWLDGGGTSSPGSYKSSCLPGCKINQDCSGVWVVG